MPVFDQTQIKAKVREFDGKIKTKFLGDEIPKENIHYTCIACITIDSIMKMDKNNYPQVYLEECKYKVKKIQMSRFIDTELESDSDSDSNSELKSDTELKSDQKQNLTLNDYNFFTHVKKVLVILLALDKSKR